MKTRRESIAEPAIMRRLRRGEGKRVYGVSPGRPRSFRYQHRAVDDCSSGRGGRRKTAGLGMECYMAKWIVAEKVKAGLRYAVVCPNVTGRTNDRIAESKRLRAGSLTIVD